MAEHQSDIPYQQDTIAAGQLARVPMFPLPNMVLLPGALVPLHIFEPRYREMTRDVLRGEGIIALARLRAGESADSSALPAVYSTLGVGRVVDSHELPDGRYDILVRGLIRATLVEELPAAHLYREVRLCELVDTDVGGPAVLEAARTKLIELCDQLSEHIQHGSSELRALARSGRPPGNLADLMVAVLVADPDVRQSLLENTDPLERMGRTMQIIARIIETLAPESAPGSLN